MPIVNNIRAEFIPVNFEKPAILKQKTIQANGVYNASDDDADGFSSVTVVVPKPAPNVQELNITPSIEPQTITVPGTIDGYGPVNVSGVENVLPENIKEGESILGVEGSVVELNGETVNITPTTNEQVIEPTAPKNAITRATVSPVTSSIDSNIQPTNIKKGATILGVSGSVIESNETTLNVTPTTSAQTLSPTSPYTGFDEVNVSAVTSSIDANIQPENIRENVTILGTTGTAHVPASYREFEYSSSNKELRNSRQVSQIANLLGAEDLGHGVFCYAYSGDTNLTGNLDMSGLTKITGWLACYMAFNYCTNITSVDMSGVKQIRGSASCGRMFEDCTGITTVDLSSLEGIYGDVDSNSFHYTCSNMFNSCSNLVSIDLSSLREMSGANSCYRMFAYCSKLESVSMPSLTSITHDGSYSCYEMFKGCAGLKTVDMRNLAEVGNNGLNRAFEGCTGLTSVNFASLASAGQYSFYRTFYNCQGLASISLTSLTGVSLHAFEECFYGCSSLTSVSLPTLQTISGTEGFKSAFYGATSLATADMRALTTVSGQNACREMFRDCTGLTDVNLSSLTAVSGDSGLYYMFQGCSELTSVDLSSLAVLGNSYAMSACFQDCTSLTSVTFHSLASVNSRYAMTSCFSGCTSLTEVFFPSLAIYATYNNQFNNMLAGCDNVTVHFPANVESRISTWASTMAGFSGTNTTVLYDLPSTFLLTGADTLNYSRNPKYDTATALAWKVGAYGTTDFLPVFYTNGTTDPQVGDTLYSDAECTTAVTTINSIA